MTKFWARITGISCLLLQRGASSGESNWRTALCKGVLSQSLDPCPAGGLKGSWAKTVKERGISTMVTIMEQFVLPQRSVWGTAAACDQVDVRFSSICPTLIPFLGNLGMGRSCFFLADSQPG